MSDEGGGVQFKGRRRDGVSVTGCATPADLAEWIESFYKRGFRTLTVTRNDIEVGGIGPHHDTNQRTWWAEQLGRTVEGE